MRWAPAPDSDLIAHHSYSHSHTITNAFRIIFSRLVIHAWFHPVLCLCFSGACSQQQHVAFKGFLRCVICVVDIW